MKHILLPILLMISYLSYGQITLSNSTFPQVGDTLLTHTDNLPTGIAAPTSGPNQYWDFSILQAPFTLETIARPASTGMASESFPNADIVVNLGGNSENYYRRTNNTYELLGFAGPDPLDLGLTTIGRYQPPIIEQRAPLDFGDNNYTIHNLILPFAWDDLPGILTDSLTLPATPDSVRLRLITERSENADAWGTAAIPSGSYDVLRIRRWEARDNRFEVKIPVVGWIDVTDQLGGMGLGMDTTITQHFRSNEIKEPVAILTLDSQEQNVQSVEYRAGDISSGLTIPAEKLGKPDVYAYPNPAIEDVRFEFSNLDSGIYTIKIYNILGRVTWQGEYTLPATRTGVAKVNISKLRKGTYLYSITNQQGKIITTRRLMVIRP